jgi:hypothetical protein
MRNVSRALAVSLLTGTLLVAYPAQGANYLTGNFIYANCNGGSHQKALCNAFVIGFTYGLLSAQRLANYKKLAPSTCIPDDVTPNQVRLIFEKYMRDHPEDLHLQASLMLSVVLDETFPCNK